METTIDKLRDLVRSAQSHLSQDWTQADEWLSRARALLNETSTTPDFETQAEDPAGSRDADAESVRTLRSKGYQVVAPLAAFPKPRGVETCCPACGSRALSYLEFVPTSRDVLDIRASTIWLEESEDQWWEGAFGACLACSECSSQFALPNDLDLEWTSEDYVRSFGADALAKAKVRRAHPRTTRDE